MFAPAFPHRFGAAIDAFLLKIVIEEELGFGVDIVPDGLSIASELSGVDDIYTALSAGQVHIYPEASSSECRARGTGWQGRIVNHGVGFRFGSQRTASDTTNTSPVLAR